LKYDQTRFDNKTESHYIIGTKPLIILKYFKQRYILYAIYKYKL